MTTACVFCIGTWHTHEEDANVLVKLWKACQLSNLGVEGNHTGLFGRGQSERISKEKRPATNGGWTWINEGQNGPGSGLKAQTAANVDLINALEADRVVLVGHSRGAVLSIGIAAALHKQTASNRNRHSPQCFLFLYDPVKRHGSAKDADFATMYDNVRDVRVIVMEDDDAPLSFGLLNMTKPIKDDYVRLPGTHGTATQVTGFPIGQVGYMLAIEWLTGVANVTMASGVDMSNRSFCREYGRINRLNPMIDGKRRVNDLKGAVASDRVNKMSIGNERAGSRSEVLDKKAGKNLFRGTGFFINDDHQRRFKAEYPTLAAYMSEARGQIDADADKKRLLNQDPGSYFLLNELSLLPP